MKPLKTTGWCAVMKNEMFGGEEIISVLSASPFEAHCKQKFKELFPGIELIRIVKVEIREVR
jgi:hypothetical protein